jgi:hypothetical protein
MKEAVQRENPPSPAGSTAGLRELRQNKHVDRIPDVKYIAGSGGYSQQRFAARCA